MRRGFMLLWMVMCVLRAEEPVMNTALEAGFYGLAVVKVHLFRGDGTSQEVRMMVDTGSAMTVIDRSLEPGFWSEDKELKGFTVGAMAASGVEVPAEPVLLYQLQFGPVSSRMPKAIRLDFTAINSAMDVPIAGIIGMNLLRGQCFRMDLRNQVLQYIDAGHGTYFGFTLDSMSKPTGTASLGVKGVGEAGTIAASAVVTNAVIDALRPLGVDYINMPLSPMRIWNAIHNSEGASPEGGLSS